MQNINNEIWKKAKVSDDVKTSEFMDLWFNGVWYDGTWLSGTWNNGLWENGIWHDGNWYGGIWKKGRWCQGQWGDPLPVFENITTSWISGIWDKGRILNIKIGWIYSKVSPKSYFKPKFSLSLNDATYKN